MQTTDGRVGVIRRRRPVRFDDAAELADELGQPGRVDRGVLDERERLAIAGHGVQQRLAGPAKFPGGRHRDGVGVRGERHALESF